jgi:ribosomal-protein-alanine N-acetyltransferase
MQVNQQPTLQTKRLTLRPFKLSDAGDTKRLVGDRAIADTALNIPHPFEDGMAEEWIAPQGSGFEEDKEATFAVTLREGESLIGVMGLKIERQHERAMLSYWIGKAHWGRGYCTEAGRTILGYGFTKLGLNRIHANHISRNPASGRVMQKLGMTHEGRGRQHAKHWGVFENLEFYAILRNEWAESLDT